MSPTRPQTSPRGPWRFEEVPCDFCESTDADPLLTGRDRLHGLPGAFAVVRCRRCGLVRTSPRPTIDSLGAAYPNDYEPHRKGQEADPPEGLFRWALVNLRQYPLDPPDDGLRRAVRWLFAWATLHRRRAIGYLPYTGRGRLLDFGCGSGGYVARMNAVGWSAEGLDLSPEAVRAAREAGLTVHEGTLPGAALAPEFYDAVTMWHALEHVPSPKATLRAAHDLLRPDGLLLVAAPRFDSLAARWFGSCWFPLELPRHLTHFTAATLCRHLEATGFHVLRIHALRRPALLRHSFALLADETGRSGHRRLARSRLLCGALSWVALLARRTQQMVVVAQRA